MGLDELSSAEIGRRYAALARAALPRFGLREDAPLALLSNRENAVFGVGVVGDPGRVVLRIHRAGYQSEASIRSELAWMEALAAADVATPPVVRARNGDRVQTVEVPEIPEPRHVDVFGWVEGAPPDAADVGRTYRLLGAVNARIHRQAATWAPPAGFERQRWDAEGLLGERRLWGRFEDLALLGPAERRLFGAAREVVLERVARFGTGPDRFGLIHADLMAENILVRDGVPRVIDFDDCGFGWRLYDPATLLFLDATGDAFAAKRDAWLAGYRSIEPLPDDQWRELPTFVMARFLVVLGWLHTRRETDSARTLGPFLVGLAREYAGRWLGR